MEIWLLITGLIAGFVGSIVGVGGGFIAVPVMTLMLSLPPQIIVGTSLTMSFANALTSTIFLWKQKRVDLDAGWKFALATLPGAVLGSKLAGRFDTQSFEWWFGLLMLGVAALMWLRASIGQTVPADRTKSGFESAQRPGSVERRIVDAWGIIYNYRYNQYLGIFFSFIIGFISSIMGIGGGIIHVPILVMLLNFPPHLAAATSLFILTWSALVGAATHLYLGHFQLGSALLLALGGILGSRAGVRVAGRLPGEVIIRVFSLAMLIVGLRLIWGS